MSLKDLNGHLSGRSNYVKEGTQAQAHQRAMDFEVSVEGLVREVSKQMEVAKEGQRGG